MLGSGKPWCADFVTQNQEDFLFRVWDSQACDVFVDEAGLAVGHYNELMAQLATQGRHFAWRTVAGKRVYGGGHNCYFIAQHAPSLAPIVRTQCRIMFAFHQWKSSAKLLSEEFGYDELLELSRFPQGEYFEVQRFKGIRRGNIFQELKQC